MSDDSENDSEMDFDDYYGETDDVEPGICDPEYFAYSCLSAEQVEQMLNEQIEALTNSVKVTPSLAKVLLHTHGWDVEKVKLLYLSDSSKLLIESQIRVAPHFRLGSYTARHSYASVCAVCLVATSSDYLRSLACGHLFCKECWITHFEVQIMQGVTTGIECMSPDCRILATEDFVLSVLSRPVLREKYLQFSFFDYVKSHPELRFCPGPNCSVIVRAVKEPKAKRVICTSCKSTFCFRCGSDYHAPADCDTIRKWLSKCEDDSETANYISAHTKDCPKCHICIEKNGGCNHMQCYSCKHDFCWMCLGDWKTHGSEYYECSRYKENPNIASESAHAQAREALKKYLHYYERWENHAKSLRLEEATVQKIRDRINSKVMTKDGTWIDWQCLLDAAALLARCRYTLQYTYPFAYFLEPGPRKELFEYQQAQLEREIENLSWQIEHAETSSRSGLENQMDIGEKCRTTLLKDFLDV